MKPLLAPLTVLSPLALGALLRELSLSATNSTLTASAGQVAPQELAHALASADRLLAGGIVLSIAFCLVWLGRASGRGRLQMACSGLLLAGLCRISVTLWGLGKMEFIPRSPAMPDKMVAEMLKRNPTNHARWPGLRQ